MSWVRGSLLIPMQGKSSRPELMERTGYADTLAGGKMKVKMNIGGRLVETEKINFHPIQEPWSVYRLEDGTTVKLRPVVSDVFKLPTPDPVTGLPQLIIKATNITSIEPPEAALSKKEVN